MSVVETSGICEDGCTSGTNVLATSPGAGNDKLHSVLPLAI